MKGAKEGKSDDRQWRHVTRHTSRHTSPAVTCLPPPKSARTAARPSPAAASARAHHRPQQACQRWSWAAWRERGGGEGEGGAIRLQLETPLVLWTDFEVWPEAEQVRERVTTN